MGCKAIFCEFASSIRAASLNLRNSTAIAGTPRHSSAGLGREGVGVALVRVAGNERRFSGLITNYSLMFAAAESDQPDQTTAKQP